MNVARNGSQAVEWLRDWEARHGRPLRVLHIGNIANNAYLNARILRAAGIDCDVVCADYYHTMACPEWEEVDFDGEVGDQLRPQWWGVDLGGYERPRWFVQGPARLCIRYLLASRSGDRPLAGQLWTELGYCNGTLKPAAGAGRRQGLRQQAYWLRRAVRAAMSPDVLQRRGRAFFASVSDSVPVAGPAIFEIARMAGGGVVAASRMLAGLVAFAGGGEGDRLSARARAFCALFDRVFPDRPDRLAVADVVPYLLDINRWRRLFRHYDVIQAYGTEPITALLGDARPYVCFEHGTLRDFTMGDSPLHRLTALAYRCSDATLVTNGDCLNYARSIGIPRFIPAIHPVDVEAHRSVDAGAAKALRERLGADVVLACPLRHDWRVKGVDVHLRALPWLRERLKGRKVVLVLIEWGAEVERSRALVEQLGCRDSVVWMKPLARRRLVTLMRAADVVLDQMTLPHFGGTAPQALSVGTPVVMSYRPESTRWLVPDPAPIVPAFSEQDVVDAVGLAISASWRDAFRTRAQRWIDCYHGPERVVADHVIAYREALANVHEASPAGNLSAAERRATG